MIGATPMVSSLLGDEVATSEPDTGTPDAPASDAPVEPAAPVTPGDEAAGSDSAQADGGDGNADPAGKAGSLLAESYDDLDLLIGEDDLLPEAYGDEVKAFAKDHALPIEAAKALVERDRARIDSDKQAWSREKDEWVKQIKSDPDLGGDKLPATIRSAKSALHKFFPPEFAQMLDRTGFGNHPDLIRGLARIGSLSAESKYLIRGDQSAPQGGTWATEFPNSGPEPGAHK